MKLMSLMFDCSFSEMKELVVFRFGLSHLSVMSFFEFNSLISNFNVNLGFHSLSSFDDQKRHTWSSVSQDLETHVCIKRFLGITKITL